MSHPIRNRKVIAQRVAGPKGVSWRVDLCISDPTDPASPPLRVRRRFAGSLKEADVAAIVADLFRLAESGRLREFVKATDRRYRSGLRPGAVFSPGGTEHPRTVAELCARWLQEHVELRNKPSQVVTARKLVRACIVADLGRMALGDITPAVVSAWLKRQSKGLDGRALAPTTVNLRRATLHSIYAWAMDMGFAVSNPVEKVAKVPDHRPVEKRRALTVEEERRFVAACRQSDAPFDTLFLVMLRTGLRVGEALGLRVEDVDFGRSEIRVCRSISGGMESTPKGGRAAVVPVPPSTLALLRLQAGRVVGGRLWPFGEMTVNRALRDVRKRAQLPDDVTAHVLRHTFGTRVAQALPASGAGPREAQALLRHSSLMVTQMYLHPDGDLLRRVVNEAEAREGAASSG